MLFDEAQLFEQLKAGDVDAYKEIYRRYHAQLYNYVRRFVKVPELAEDVLHDVFIKLWEIREQLNPQLPVVAYIYRITRNHVFKLIKKISVETELRSRVISIIDSNYVEPESEMQWLEYAHLLEGAIDQLSPQCKKVFKLCRQEGKTYEETAQELGISKHTVKEHMMNAMKSIKNYFVKHADIAFTLLMMELLKR